MTDRQERTITIKSAVDLNIVGENILDIADFAIEKHEFQNDTRLSDEDRKEAVKRIRDALWEKVNDFRAKRQQWLQQMFDTADAVVEELVDGS